MSCIVIYYSKSGTTKAVATELSRQLNCDTQAIVPAKRYSRLFLKCLFRAYREKRDNALPKLKGLINLELYDTILLGYPVWMGSCPRVLFSFIKAQRITGKQIIPFCTYRGSAGTGDKDLMNEFPNLTWRGVLAVKASHAKNCSGEVAAFIEKQKLVKNSGEERK
ncbi:MAG: hypothetical protein IJT95_00885 [Abditibacteriota bacterium]|nr:hypothetical protein [Abditibacteriota bacterium]